MNRFIKPPIIKEGDAIGIIAPSDGIFSEKEILNSKQIVEKWGLKVKIGKHLISKDPSGYAGSPVEKQEDFLRMIKDKEVKIIWAVHGGYSANDVLPIFKKEVIENFRRNPKWVIGYSDISLILNTLVSFKIANIHFATFARLSDLNEKSLNYIKKFLFEGSLGTIDKSYDWKVIIPGKARGRILATNFESLIFNLGTKYDPILHGNDDIILALEEIFEEKSKILRMLDTLFHHKKAYRIKAIILGRFLGIFEKSYFSKFKVVSLEELIENRMRARFYVPLVKLEDFGHTRSSVYLEESFWKKLLKRKTKETFIPFVNGAWATLETIEDKAQLVFDGF